MFDTKNILLIGGDGYIGRTLESYLSNTGHNVEVYDRKISKTSVQDDEASLSFAEVIVYLAAYPGAEACKENPKRAIADNIVAPIVTVYNECVEMRAAAPTFIFISSLGARDPFQNFYVTTKWIIEQEMMRLSEVKNIDTRILRLANVYGGPDYLSMKNSVIAKFAKMKAKGEMMVLAGDGSQERDFIHLYDVCKAIKLCAESENDYSLPVDIGTGRGTSIENLAKMFNHKFTFDSKSDMIGTKKSVADTKLAKNIWGFEAKRKLEDYIKWKE